MSRSEAEFSFGDLTMELSARCLEAIENDQLHSIPNDQLGNMFATILRVFGAKAQRGEAALPFGGNIGVTVTDVAIGCTAMMDVVGLQLFELGAWQTMTSVRPHHTHK
ncbi:MAG: hypothetical protein ABI579_09295 [Candidatus Sumerlaeota bacterium]